MFFVEKGSAMTLETSWPDNSFSFFFRLFPSVEVNVLKESPMTKFIKVFFGLAFECVLGHVQTLSFKDL